MKRIMMLAESQSQADLFLRFTNAALLEGFEPILVTAKRSIALRCRTVSVSCILVRGTSGPAPDLSTTGDVKNGLLDSRSAQRYYASFAAAVSGQRALGADDIVAVWGGGDTAASRALLDAAAQQGCCSLYCDRTNIPGRLFADPKGTNFNSLLFTSMARLDQDDPDEAAFDAVRQQMKQLRRIPEESGPMVRILRSVQDRTYSLVNGLPYRGVMPWKKNRAAALIRTERDDYPIEGSRFVFLPLIDSFELTKEPEGSNVIERMFREARTIAQQHSADLVVKFHPAEQNGAFVEQVVTFRKEFGFRIVTEDARILRAHACALAAPNTSIALEGMIEGTPVHHIGRSFFGHFDRRRLVNFVTRYLLPIEPTDTMPLSIETFRMIVQRAQLR